MSTAPKLWEATVRPPLHPALADSECAQDILDVLYSSSSWMTTRDVYDALEAARKVWGYSSAKTTLCLMVKLGVLRSRRSKPFGYMLAERVPQRKEV